MKGIRMNRGGIAMREEAAGGVVIRKEGGAYLFLMIEDRFGHWSFPKGHLEEGEVLRETALREIKEETGVEGEIIAPLPPVIYQYDAEGRKGEKEVHYFLVQYTKGEVRPQREEIGNVHWLSPNEAWEKQVNYGYENNQPILERAFTLLGLTYPNESTLA